MSRQKKQATLIYSLIFLKKHPLPGSMLGGKSPDMIKTV
jgi:hypothetical protein